MWAIVKLIDSGTNKTNVKADKDKSIIYSYWTKLKILGSQFNEIWKIYSVNRSLFWNSWNILCESQTVQKALEAENSSRWIETINEELESLIENEMDGTICKYKDRLVVKGYTQKDGIERNDLSNEIWYC